MASPVARKGHFPCRAGQGEAWAVEQPPPQPVLDLQGAATLEGLPSRTDPSPPGTRAGARLRGLRPEAHTALHQAPASTSELPSAKHTVGAQYVLPSTNQQVKAGLRRWPPGRDCAGQQSQGPRAGRRLGWGRPSTTTLRGSHRPMGGGRAHEAQKPHSHRVPSHRHECGPAQERPSPPGSCPSWDLGTSRVTKWPCSGTGSQGAGGRWPGHLRRVWDGPREG